MFGYIIANGKALSEEQLCRYRGWYCGLCRSLKERHGSLSRLTLTFDMTFLIMLLSSMYEPEEQTGEGRCIIHPLKSREYRVNRFSDYAADMNVALAYHNCVDDWQDDRRIRSLWEAKLLKRSYDGIAEKWPRQCAAMEKCMAGLSLIERGEIKDPDAGANCFGELMGELFVCYEEPLWQDKMRAFGESLGRFIYMMDACVDYEKDMRRGRYNPLAAMGESLAEDEKLTILKVLIGECTKIFELLPLVQDLDIMRNVLYSGVWIQYSAALKKEKEDAKFDS